MSDEPATRRELEQLRADVIRMDDHGTRGTAVLGAQQAEFMRDIAELKAEITGRFAEHQRQHEIEAAGRTAARRWTLGFSAAAAAAVGALYPYLYLLLHR